MSFLVFGYGSLVNRATLPPVLDAWPATVTGWRRAWKASSKTPRGGVCALSVHEGEGAIEGFVLRFEETEWPTIAQREYRYDPLTVDIGGDDVTLFRAKAEIDRYGSSSNPISMTYLETTLQGFLHEFGEEGLFRFMDSTDGWHVPILDDRANPRYPRAQLLSNAERQLVDEALKGVDATVIPASGEGSLSIRR